MTEEPLERCEALIFFINCDGRSCSRVAVEISGSRDLVLYVLSLPVV
jgi:hypothetical protein